MSKVPCGGFKLDENFLGMNENDELSLVGGGSEGKAYKHLVTDGDGNTKWEDRLAYEGSRLVVDTGHSVQYVKVSDEVPSWASIDAPMKVWVSDRGAQTKPVEAYLDLGNGSFAVGEYVLIITTANIELEFYDIVLPEKGVYFASVPDNFYVTGIASADSNTPKITWDGNIETIKTIDPKYIPSELNEIILPSSTPSSTKKFKIAVNDNGAISATEITT